MAPHPLVSRAGLRLRLCWRAVAGWRIYALALVMALPDILDALAGLDLTPLLPAWLPGTKVAALLTLARIVAGAYAAKLAAVAPKGPASGPGR